MIGKNFAIQCLEVLASTLKVIPKFIAGVKLTIDEDTQSEVNSKVES